MTQNSGAAQHSGEDGELVAVIGTITLVVFAVIIWFRFRAGIVAGIKWIYGLIATPFYAISSLTGTTIGSAILCFLLAGLMVFFAFRAKKNKKNADTKIGLAVVFALWGVTEFVLTRQSSLVQSPINVLCNPKDVGSLFPLLDCQRQTGSVGFLELLVASVAINMLFAVKRIVESIGGMARIAKDHPDNKFKKKHTVDSFIEEMQIVEPHLRVFSDINPNLLDSDKGDLRNMDGTRRFCYTQNLISGFRARQEIPNINIEKEKQLKEQNPNDLTINEDDLVPQVDENRFVEIMTEQLGDVWVGLDNLSAGELILLAIAVPKCASYDEDMSDDEFYKIEKNTEAILEYMWDWTKNDQHRAYKEGEVDEGLEAFDKLDEYRELIEKYIDHEEVKKVTSKHAYNRTVIISMFTKARGLGILPPCEVRWLWLYDRTLWYTVQNIDRPSFACEGLGAVSHWLMETRLESALHQPSFDVAFFGLSDQLSEFKYTQEDQANWKKYKEQQKKDRFNINNDDNLLQREEDALQREQIEEVFRRLEDESIVNMSSTHELYKEHSVNEA